MYEISELRFRPEIIEEEVFTNYTAAHHQGAIKMFWIQFWRALPLFFIDLNCRPYDT